LRIGDIADHHVFQNDLGGASHDQFAPFGGDGERRERLGDERLSHLERVLYLRAIDFFWKEHLSNIDHLKEGIGLRGYGQKNPLHEYQREAFELFSSVMFLIKTALLQNLFLPELPSEEELRQIEEQEREMQRQLEAQAQTIHHDVLEEGEPEEEGEPALTGNREERRRKEKAAGKGRRG
jgi:preprotein translocase subunit SecA